MTGIDGAGSAAHSRQVSGAASRYGGDPAGGGEGSSFDRYARMVRRALGVPLALVTIVEADRQRFPGASGLPEPFATTRETPLEYSFCQLLLVDDKPLVVHDARVEAVLQNSPALNELGVIAYAAWPLRDHTGATVGALCAIDHQPREWTEDDLDSLADLAAACSAEIAQRELQRGAVATTSTAEGRSDHARTLLALSESLAETRTLTDIATAIEPAGRELGCSRVGMWLTSNLRNTFVEASDPLVDGILAEPRAGDALQFVPSFRDEWSRASLFATMAGDESNPIGATYLSGMPSIFHDHTEQNELYPDLATTSETGEARFFVPLRVGLQVFGTMVLIWPERIDRFSRDLGEAITSLAAYTAQAVHRALLLEERVEAAVVLQNSMLTELPAVDGYEIAAKYRPAAARDQVGGDWYDVVTLESGATLLVIGDVVGHDLEAAAVMAQYRSILRALAWPGDLTPARILERLDQTAAGLGINVLASVIVAIVTGDTLAWANAGHLPPLLIDSTGITRLVEPAAPEPMLAVRPSIQRSDHALRLNDEDTFIFYTDGLVERRGEHLDDSLKRLLDVAADHADQPTADLPRQLSRSLVEQTTDDLAILVVRKRSHSQDPEG